MQTASNGKSNRPRTQLSQFAQQSGVGKNQSIKSRGNYILPNAGPVSIDNTTSANKIKFPATTTHAEISASAAAAASKDPDALILQGLKQQTSGTLQAMTSQTSLILAEQEKKQQASLSKPVKDTNDTIMS